MIFGEMFQIKDSLLKGTKYIYLDEYTTQSKSRMIMCCFKDKDDVYRSMTLADYNIKRLNKFGDLFTLNEKSGYSEKTKTALLGRPLLKVGELRINGVMHYSVVNHYAQKYFIKQKDLFKFIPKILTNE